LQHERGGCGGASPGDCGTSPNGRARSATSQNGAAAGAGDARGSWSGAGALAGGAAANGHDERAGADWGSGLGCGAAGGAARGGCGGQEGGGGAGAGPAQREAGPERAWREEDAVRLVSELPQVPASGLHAPPGTAPSSMAAQPVDAARLCSSAGRGGAA
jgi:hypothetical protein